MDPVSAVGIAAAAVQFFDYGSKIIAGAIAIYDDASHKSQEEIDAAVVTNNLKFCLEGLRNSTHQIPRATKEEASQEDLRKRCELLAKELVDAFGTVQHESKLANANKPKKMWLSFGHAIRLTAWKKEDIQKLQKRLHDLQEELMISISADTWKAVNLLRNEVAINQSLTKDYINDGHNKTIKKMQDVRLHLSTLISERTVLLLIVIVIAIGSQMWWNYSTTIQQHREADQKLQNDIANWLSPLEYSHKQNDMFDLRYPGTGKWLLESSRFNDWLSGSNQTLVLEGMPGAGKSVLVSTAINFLQRNKPPPRYALCYAYCDYKNIMQQTPEQIISALLKQLVLSETLSHQMVSLYQYHKKSRDHPNLEELVQAIRDESERYSSLFIVVDALDECFDRAEITSQLIKALSALAPYSKILVSSRPHINSRRLLPNSKHIEVVATKQDLETYVETRLSPTTGSDLARLVHNHEDLYQEILQTVVTKANGMFLLAQLHMDSLAEKTSVRSIKRALPDLSTVLSQAHEKALSRVESQNDDARELATQVFSLISHAFRQITVDELQSALAVEQGQTEFDREGIVDSSYILSVCSGLVVIEKESKIIRFVHYSTHEYFNTIRDTKYPDGHANYALACLTLLSMQDFSELPCSSIGEIRHFNAQNPFYNYAAEFWGDHAKQAEATVLNEISGFLERSNDTFCSVQAKIAQESRPDINWLILRQPVSRPWIAAWFGLDLTVSVLLQLPQDVNTQPLYAIREIYADTPLQKASDAGNTGVVRLLLKSGANPNDYGGEHGNSLSAATFHGHTDIVALLLDAGALPDPPSSANANSPLSIAAQFGYEDIVKVLIRKGANLSNIGGDGTTLGSALQAASHGGHKSIVQLLLSEGADVNLQGGRLLYSVTKYRNTHQERIPRLRSVVQKDIWRSLRYPEQFRLESTWCDSPLHCAALHGHVDVARLLLLAGADINNPGTLYGTPLQEASAAGKLDMVRFLISEGAAVNAAGVSFGTALHAASLYGRDDVAELLIQHGARWKGTGPGPFGHSSPLQVAIARGHHSTVQVLLRHYNRVERPFVWFYNLVSHQLHGRKKQRELDAWSLSGGSVL